MQVHCGYRDPKPCRSRSVNLHSMENARSDPPPPHARTSSPLDRHKWWGGRRYVPRSATLPFALRFLWCCSLTMRESVRTLSSASTALEYCARGKSASLHAPCGGGSESEGVSTYVEETSHDNSPAYNVSTVMTPPLRLQGRGRPNTPTHHRRIARTRSEGVSLTLSTTTPAPPPTAWPPRTSGP